MDRKIINTHLIIRYLINDNSENYKITRDFFDLVKFGKTRAYLEQAVFAEAVFILEITYAVPRDKIAKVFTGLLEYRGIYNTEKEVLVRSLHIYAKTDLRIIDAIIEAKAELNNLEVQKENREDKARAE